MATVVASDMIWSNQDRWPNLLRLDLLDDNARDLSPYGEDFDYGEAFEELDYEQVKADRREKVFGHIR